MKVHSCQFLPDFLNFAKCVPRKGALGIIFVMTLGINLTVQAAEMTPADLVLSNGELVTVEKGSLLDS